MTTRRTVLKVEELGTRLLPSGTVTAAVAATAQPAHVPTKTVPRVTGPSWSGHGRYTVTTPNVGAGRTYQFQGSADFGKSGFFAVKGSIQTVGNVKSGQA